MSALPSEPDRLHYPAVKRNAKRARKNRRVKTIDLTPQQWHEILIAHDHCCAYCGIHLAHPTMDHIVALSRGGSHTASNVIPACEPCNTRKGSTYVTRFLTEEPSHPKED